MIEARPLRWAHNLLHHIYSGRTYETQQSTPQPYMDDFSQHSVGTIRPSLPFDSHRYVRHMTTRDIYGLVIYKDAFLW